MHNGCLVSSNSSIEVSGFSMSFCSTAPRLASFQPLETERATLKIATDIPFTTWSRMRLSEEVLPTMYILLILFILPSKKCGHFKRYVWIELQLGFVWTRTSRLLPAFRSCARDQNKCRGQICAAPYRLSLSLEGASKSLEPWPL